MILRIPRKGRRSFGMTSLYGVLLRRVVRARLLVCREFSPMHTKVCLAGGLSCVESNSGLVPASEVFQASNTWSGVRHMSSDISALPELSNPQAKKALNALLATNWSKIEKGVSEAVEVAIAKGGVDGSVLSTVWSSARASEKFAATLISLRMELDDLSGAEGEFVGRLPDTILRALEAAFSKYTTYLESFEEKEQFLKRKLENDLGSILVQIKQRCSGLDSKWGTVTLLGTSGLSGSYIERRRHS